MAKDAAQRGGDAYGTGAVRAVRQRAQPRGHRCRGAATGGARGAVQLPWVAARRTQEVVAHVLVPVVRRVGLPDHDAAGALGAFRHQAVAVRDVVGEEPGAKRAAQAGDRLQVLYRHRQAVQGARRLALHDARLRRLRRLACPLAVHRQEGVDMRVHRLDACQHRVHDFHRRKPPLPNCCRQFGGWCKTKLRCVHRGLLPQHRLLVPEFRVVAERRA